MGDGWTMTGEQPEVYEKKCVKGRKTNLCVIWANYDLYAGVASWFLTVGADIFDLHSDTRTGVETLYPLVNKILLKLGYSI